MPDRSADPCLTSSVEGQHVALHRDPARLGGQPDVAGVLDRYQRLVGLAAPHVGTDALHWLGHFVNGDATFSVDVLDDDDLGGVFAGEEDGPDQLRQVLLKLGRRLNYDLARIDNDLRGLRTGRLIRVVFDLETVSVYWYWIHAREYLVGITFAGGQVDEADREVAEVAENILAWLRRPPRNYGGFSRGLARRRDAVTPPTAHGVRVKRSLRPPADVEELTRLCHAAVDPRDLHYVSLFVAGSWTLSADVLDVDAATRDFGSIPADLRRSLYEQVGKAIQYDIAEFDRLLSTVTRHRPGRLLRTVFDVESGALYHHILDVNRYLLGVTVYQDEVAYADDRVRTLAADLVAGGGLHAVGVA